MLTLLLAITKGQAIAVMVISAMLLVVSVLVALSALYVGKEADRKMRDLLEEPQPFECDYCMRKAVLITPAGKACSIHAHHLEEGEK
jgi:hypothetical protein